MFATAPQITSLCAPVLCVQAAAQEQEPSLPTSVPLSRDTVSTVQENTKDTCQAPPAHEMHFIALLSPFLMSDVPAGTLAAVPTRWKGCEDPVLCNHVTVALLRCKQQSQTDLPTASASVVSWTHTAQAQLSQQRGQLGQTPLLCAGGCPQLS